jgi:hypothetical protein
LFDLRVPLAERISGTGSLEASPRASGYANLSAAGKANVAQLHPHDGGVALVLRSRDGGLPNTSFAEIPVTTLNGCRGANAGWLTGTGRPYERKGPAVAYLIPAELGELGDGDLPWQEVAALIAYAKDSL